MRTHDNIVVACLFIFEKVRGKHYARRTLMVMSDIVYPGTLISI